MDMNVTNTPADNSTTSNAQIPKIPKRRISRLSADEIRNLPGANAVVEKKVEPEFTYYLTFIFPVTGTVGSLDEATQVLRFASQLDIQARSKGVGTVWNHAAAEGSLEVVLKLNSSGQESSHGVPASNAFTQLKDFLTAETVLINRNAKWKAKVNGTTIADGRF